MNFNQKKLNCCTGRIVVSLFFGLFLMAACQSKSSKTDEQQLLVGDDIAIAQTQYGKVQGFILRDIYQFRGIPYGDNTAGKNRFMPPQPPQPWDDIRPAVWWGNTAP